VSDSLFCAGGGALARIPARSFACA